MEKNNEILLLLGFCLLVGTSVSQASVSGTESSVEKNEAATNLTKSVELRQQEIAKGEERARGIMRKVRGMAEEARVDGDVVKIPCLDAAMEELAVNLAGLEGQKQALAMSVAAGDKEGADHAILALGVYMENIDSLGVTAEGCVGMRDMVVGESTVETTVDRDVSERDPTEDPPLIPQRVETDQLPRASGYL